MARQEQQLATHPMRTVRVEKLTLNIGAGKDAQLLNKGVKLLEAITGIPPVKTVTQKRIPGWGLRPGLPIGCKITLRREAAEQLIPRLLASREHLLSERNYDVNGNVSFGIPEYIDIEGASTTRRSGSSACRPASRSPARATASSAAACARRAWASAT